MTRRPEVSVLMTVWNGAAFLEECLRSVFAQSHADFELVVVDDGSTDATPEILQRLAEPRLRVERSARIGRTPALNLGLAEARGEFVAVLDADDTARADRLARQAELLRAEPAIVLVASWFDMIDEAGRSVGAGRPAVDHDAIVDSFATANPVAHSTVMYRREAAIAAGSYPARYAFAQDFGLYLALLRRGGRFAVLPEALVALRTRPGSMSTGPALRLARPYDALQLFREVLTIPGLSAAARRRCRRRITRAALDYGAALRADGRAVEGSLRMAAAALRRPDHLLADWLDEGGRARLAALPGVRRLARLTRRAAAGGGSADG